VNLARLILEDTDILLLDEPTNHLDLHATEWLEDYIRRFRGTVLAISHDRWFLDAVAQRCIEIVDGRAEFYSGNYSFYVEERQRRFDEQMKKYEKDQAKLEQLKKAAEQMHLWAFMGNDKLHKRAFSMEKRMEKLSATAKPGVQKKLNVKFSERDFNGDEIYLMEGLGKSFGEKALFHDIDLLIEGTDRIALIGDNGTGKSTFLKILMGEELPDRGFLRRGPSVKTAYLPQIIRFEHPERSLYDTMLYEENCTPQAARDRLGQFQFSGEDVFKPVSALSGGELSRLRLCMLMKHDINFLILDEPTNHLDIASREWIEDAVADYGGALLFVSHDRWFIEKFANRIWELRDGEITDFRGSFSQFREYRARQESITQTAARKETKKKDAEPKKKPAQNLEKQLARLEREIARTEEQIAALDEESEAYSSDYQKLLEIGEKRDALDAELDGLYRKWEELST
ncbi:MAG: ABC-F family ATP-binding cassette domain-containing protein, partial [Oscillospiraceae bacterium]